MKAIDMLKSYRSILLHNLIIEVRVNNCTQKVVTVKDWKAIEDDPIFHREVSNWFINKTGCVDGQLILDFKEE